MTIQSLYTFGNAANVSANNFTTLYNSGAQVINPQQAYGNADVVALLNAGTDGANTVGNITATGNIVAANVNAAIYATGYYYANGAPLNLNGNYSNANVAAYLPTYTGNLQSNNVSILTDLTVGGQTTTSGDITTSQDITAGGSIQATGNIRTTGLSGNITGANYISAAYYLGDGGLLSNIATNAYSNANVTSLLANFGSNVVSTTGNITGGYFVGNGSQLTGLPASYSNANVATFLASFGSNTISTTGNITGGYILGNGSQLTGLPATYGNANVVTLLANFGSNTVSTTGNVTGGNVVSSGQISATANVTGGNILTGGVVSATGNVTGGNILTGGAVSATGNVTGSYIFGNGSQLTGIASSYGNSNVTSLLAAFGSNTISTTGSISSGAITATGNVVPGSGGRYLGKDTSITGGDTWTGMFVGFVSASGNVTAPYFIGNGSQLTGITSTYGNSNVANFLTSYTGNIAANNISTTGNVTISGNLVSDDITSSNVTVYGDQVITGNLTVQGNTTTINSNVITTNDKNITVANNQSTQANVDGAGLDAGNPAIATWRYNALTDSWQSNIGITPTGNGLQALGGPVNQWGTFYVNRINAVNNITTESGYISAAGNVTGGNLVTAGQVTATGNITGNYILGNGSQLTGLPATYSNVNVATFLANFGSNTISTTGNITGGYFVGNGSQLTGMYGNANVVTLLAGFGSNVISTTGNITGGNLVTGGILTATGGINTADGVSAGGNISTSGNVIGSYLYGDGSNITGSVQHAAAIQFPVKNTSGGTLTRGTPIYVTGTVGATDTVEVSASRADTLSTMGTVGLLESTLAINATGYAVSVGILSGFDTSTYTVGAPLYVAPTGGLTQNRPTGANVVQSVGVVGRVNASTGAVEVNIWNYQDLPNLGSGNVWLGNAAGYPTQTTLATYTGTIGAGTVSASGNVTGGNIITGGLISAAGNITSTSNLIGGNVLSTGIVSATANITGGNLITGGILTATGNITGGNVLSLGVVSSTGNITAPYYIGNGSQLTGIVATSSYGDSNVATFLAAYGANTFSSTGTVTAGNITGGNLITGGAVTATANITGGNLITGGLINSTGNITGGNVLTGGLISSTGNITGGNIRTAGLITATGNVTASYYFGNGSQLTGITAAIGGNLSSDLYANTYALTSLANGNVTITANGTGVVNTSKQKLATFSETVYAYGNTGAATITPDFANGSIQQLTLTGNITMNSLANAVAGSSMTLILTQDATGSRILTSTMKWSGGFKTLSTAANAIDIATVFYDGTNYYASLSRGYA